MDERRRFPVRLSHLLIGLSVAASRRLRLSGTHWGRLLVGLADLHHGPDLCDVAIQMVGRRDVRLLLLIALVPIVIAIAIFAPTAMN